MTRAVVHARDADGFLLFAEGHQVVLAGRYSLPCLPPGRVYLEAFGDGFATSEPEAVNVEAGRIVQQDLRLVAATLVTLVLDGVEAGENDVVLSLRDTVGREHAGVRESHVGPRDDLSRRFGPLPPGQWHAEARLPDGRTAKEDFTLTGEKERTVILRFSPR